MIQINLLPNVKSQYIATQKKKRSTLLITVSISGVALAIVILMATYVYGGQKWRLSSLESDIKKNSEAIKKIPDLNKILTVQNQLNSINSLHEQKPVTGRFFTYLPQITPTNVQISKLTLNIDEKTMEISGNASSLETVNKFVDTLKFTDFTTDQDKSSKKAFSSVVMTTFGVGTTSQESKYPISFTITLKYEEQIFSSDNKDVTLVVPKITSTRSETERPDALFKTQKINNPETP